ncbi:hypothetical protein KVR01_006186 [Diaporthe batatas]|uniref:uncharacterized protein n=1 Tax=Diaporthe batatas TaxID=748121 RepID=UPI001D04B1FE|nr:uncharacterized protein KVR01_006186 [Diaporthe batatas]KAG8164268.1 hypothetical protein KVR01_006186 [Diaporthe batatas]
MLSQKTWQCWHGIRWWPQGTSHRLAVQPVMGAANDDHVAMADVEPPKGGFSSVLDARNGDAVLVSGESAGTVGWSSHRRNPDKQKTKRKTKRRWACARETNRVDTALLCLTLRQARVGTRRSAA